MIRTQRVIDSNIFDKLEKELQDYSMDYKKLLIEKIKLEKEYDKNLFNYNKVKGEIFGQNTPQVPNTVRQNSKQTTNNK